MKHTELTVIFARSAFSPTSPADCARCMSSISEDDAGELINTWKAGGELALERAIKWRKLLNDTWRAGGDVAVERAVKYPPHPHLDPPAVSLNDPTDLPNPRKRAREMT